MRSTGSPRALRGAGAPSLLASAALCLMMLVLGVGRNAAAVGAPAHPRRVGAPSHEVDRRPAKSGRAAVSPPRGSQGTSSRRSPPERGSATSRNGGGARGGSAGAIDAGVASRDEAPRPDPDDRDRERIVRMQETIGEILHSRALGHLRIGMRVMSVRTGRLFYGRRGDTLMDPASNQKVLATTAALMRLGGDWRYRTEITGPAPDDEGVVHGNLHLRGNGDPTLRSFDFDEVAARLRALGVARVDGGIIADPRLFGGEGAPSDAEAGDTRASLIVDRGITVVRVRPGPTAGAAPAVLTEAHRFSDEAGGGGVGFIVKNQATTRPSGRTRITVRVDLAEGRLRVNVSGKIAVGAAGVSFRRRVPHPALHTAVVLRAALIGAGIAVRGAPNTGATPPGDNVLDVHESAPLTVVLRRINKDSDNEQAERVLQTVGAEAFGPPATTEKGLAVLRAVIGSLGLRPSSYVPRNGSGLGHINRITANAMADLLRALYFDPRIGPEILQSLSVGGIDGTTRNRFKGTLAARRVRAKTGTLDGKSCLSGLVGDGDDLLVFSMMMQGFRGRSLAAVRASQVGAVNAMMRYVREGNGERVALPAAGVDEGLAGSDVEASGDNDESGEEGEIERLEPVKPAPGEDAVDAVLRQARAQPATAGASPAGAGGAAGSSSPPAAPVGAGGAGAPRAAAGPH